MKKISFALVAVLTLSGCASIVDGNGQHVTVSTQPEQGAACTLTNSKGTYHIPSTPGTTSVQSAYGDLIVTCKKGSMNGTAAVASSTKGMAFGNIIAGGIIGGVVDCASGAAYAYPSEILIDLK